MSNKLLKFRVWNAEDKHWDNPSILEVWDDTGKLEPFGFIKSGKLNPVYAPIENYIIQQFTGLIDKNDKEVYCGDIIQFKVFEDWGDYTGQIVKYYVEWCQYDIGWRAFTKGMRDKNCAGIKIQEPFEVIGNTFETSEILN